MVQGKVVTASNSSHPQQDRAHTTHDAVELENPCTSSDAAAHVAVALSDVVVAPPSASKHTLADAPHNAAGQRVAVLRVGGLSSPVLSGHAAAGHRVATLLSVPAGSFAGVAVVPAASFTDVALSAGRLSVEDTHDDALLARHADASALLLSASPQEAHDLAVAAHAILAADRSAFVVHALDGCGLDGNDASASSVRVLRPAALARVAAIAVKAAAAHATSAHHCAVSVLAAIGAPTFVYSGADAPGVVLVALGAVGAAAGDLASKLSAASGLPVGVLRPLLVSPIDTAGLLAVLPQTARHVIVLNVVGGAGGASAQQQQQLVNGGVPTDALFSALSEALTPLKFAPTLHSWRHVTSSMGEPASFPALSLLLCRAASLLGPDSPSSGLQRKLSAEQEALQLLPGSCDSPQSLPTSQSSQSLLSAFDSGSGGNGNGGVHAQQGQGLSPVEAMSAVAAALATSVPGGDEVLVGGLTGLTARSEAFVDAADAAAGVVATLLRASTAASASADNKQAASPSSPSSSSSGGAPASLLSDVAVWGLSHDGVAATAPGTARLLAKAAVAAADAGAGAHTSSYRRGVVELPAAGMAKVLGVTLTRMSTSGSSGSGAGTTGVTVVSHPAILAHFNCVAGVRPGGVLLVGAPSAAAPAGDASTTTAAAGSASGAAAVPSPEDDAPSESVTGAISALLSALPASDARELRSKGARLFTVDAHALAREHAQPAALAAIVAAAAATAPPGEAAATGAAAKEAAIGALSAAVLQAAVFALGAAASDASFSSSPLRWARLVGALEAEQKAALPAPLHAALPSLYSALAGGGALLRVPLSVGGAAESASSSNSARRPFVPRAAAHVSFGRPQLTSTTTRSHAAAATPQSHTTTTVVSVRSGASAAKAAAATAATSAQRHAQLAVVFPAAYAARAPQHAAAASSSTEPAGHAAAADAAHSSSAATAPAAGAAPAAAAAGGHDVTYIARVSVNKRLTPASYDRNIFHMELDITGTGLTYEIGSALGVHGCNATGDVLALCAALGVAPDSVVSLPAEGGGLRRLTTAFRLFSSELDIGGRPGRDFYGALAAYACDAAEATALRALGDDAGAGADAYKAAADESATFAEVLAAFPSARPPLAALAVGPAGLAIPPIKPRHYSIASAQRAHPTSVHLLVVEVGWTTPLGKKTRWGQCSHYLSGLAPGASVRVSVLPSEMHLPASHSVPVVMAGLGTGMAPFRAFLQERAAVAAEAAARGDSSSATIGSMALYVGSRSRAQEFLYGDELEAYVASGLLTRLRTAFSRDGPKKVYIQHLMEEDRRALATELGPAGGRGSFYLCGPTWPEADVEAAITSAFEQHGDGSSSSGEDGQRAAAGAVDGGAVIATMKAEKRYVLELY